MADVATLTAPEEASQPSSGMKILEVFESGWAVDGRGIAPLMAKHICENTAYMQAERNWQVPVHPSHPSCEDMPEQAIEGYATNFRYAIDATGEGKVLADVNMSGQLKADYDAGKYRGWSVGLSGESLYMRDGRELGPAIAHLAMLGRDNAALPDLNEVTQAFAAKGKVSTIDRVIRTFINAFQTISKRFATSPDPQDGEVDVEVDAKAMKGQASMDQAAAIKACEDALKAFMASWENLKQAISAEETGEGEPDPTKAEGEPMQADAPKSAEEGNLQASAEFKAMQAQLKQFETERETARKEAAEQTFEAMRLPAAIKAEFVDYAMTKGLDKAKTTFAFSKVPPQPVQFPGGMDPSTPAEDSERAAYEAHKRLNPKKAVPEHLKKYEPKAS